MRSRAESLRVLKALTCCFARASRTLSRISRTSSRAALCSRSRARHNAGKVPLLRSQGSEFVADDSP
ncbi:uncharacterized [Tachysurus ichikawai]